VVAQRGLRVCPQLGVLLKEGLQPLLELRRIERKKRRRKEVCAVCYGQSWGVAVIAFVCGPGLPAPPRTRVASAPPTHPLSPPLYRPPHLLPLRVCVACAAGLQLQPEQRLSLGVLHAPHGGSQRLKGVVACNKGGGGQVGGGWAWCTRDRLCQVGSF